MFSKTVLSFFVIGMLLLRLAKRPRCLFQLNKMERRYGTISSRTITESSLCLLRKQTVAWTAAIIFWILRHRFDISTMEFMTLPRLPAWVSVPIAKELSRL